MIVFNPTWRAPNWAPGAAEALKSLLQPSDWVLEFGSGQSTPWLAMCVERVITVEHDLVWLERVRGYLGETGVTNVTQVYAPQLGDRYVETLHLLRMFPGRRVVAIDGWLRREVWQALPEFTKPGDLIVCDDALDYIRPEEVCGTLRRFEEPHPLAGLPVKQDRPTISIHERHPPTKETWIVTTGDT